MTLETLPIGPPIRKTPLYKSLWVQVLFGIVVAVILGRIDPKAGIAMKPLGDAFIRLISMVITIVIFCTVVSASRECRTSRRSDASAARRCFILK